MASREPLDSDEDLGRKVGSLRGHGGVGRSIFSFHGSSSLIMDVFEDGVAVGVPFLRRLDVMCRRFRWRDMGMLWLAPDTVCWRAADGWKWVFRVLDSGGTGIVQETLNRSAAPYAWREKSRLRDWF